MRHSCQGRAVKSAAGISGDVQTVPAHLWQVLPELLVVLVSHLHQQAQRHLRPGERQPAWGVPTRAARRLVWQEYTCSTKLCCKTSRLPALGQNLDQPQQHANRCPARPPAPPARLAASTAALPAQAVLPAVKAGPCIAHRSRLAQQARRGARSAPKASAAAAHAALSSARASSAAAVAVCPGCLALTAQQRFEQVEPPAATAATGCAAGCAWAGPCIAAAGQQNAGGREAVQRGQLRLQLRGLRALMVILQNLVSRGRRGNTATQPLDQGSRARHVKRHPAWACSIILQPPQAAAA